MQAATVASRENYSPEIRLDLAAESLEERPPGMHHVGPAVQGIVGRPRHCDTMRVTRNRRW
jgi:hypothetical protein